MNEIQTRDALTLDEESKTLLRRILERAGYRQIMAANIRGHGLKYLFDVEQKSALVRDLGASLATLREVERLYASIGGSDLTLAVRDAMDRIPYPYSRLELAVCLALCDRAERLVASSYVDGKSPEMGAIARSLVEMERESTRLLEEQLAEFCAEPMNRATAQQFVNRWLALTLVAFGRPDTPGDQRAFALKLRTQRASALVKHFLDDARTLLTRCHLTLPALGTLDVELKADVLAAFQDGAR